MFFSRWFKGGKNSCWAWHPWKWKGNFLRWNWSHSWWWRTLVLSMFLLVGRGHWWWENGKRNISRDSDSRYIRQVLEIICVLQCSRWQISNLTNLILWPETLKVRDGERPAATDSSLAYENFVPWKHLWNTLLMFIFNNIWFACQGPPL